MYESEEFQREKISKPLKWLIMAIWIIVIVIGPLLFFVSFFSSIFDAGRVGIFYIAIGIGIINIFSTKLVYFSKKPLSTQTLWNILTIEIVIAQIFITIAIHATGGIETVAVHLFHFITLFTLMAYSSRGVILFSVTSAVMLWSLFFLEHIGVIEHLPRYANFASGAFGNAEITFLNGAVTGLWIIAVAVFGSFIGHIIRKREEQIFAERHRVSVIISDLPDGILLLDPDHRLIFMNPSAANIAGVSADKALNKNFHPDNREQGFEKLHDLLFTLPSQKDNTEIPVSSLPSFEYMIGDKDRERYFEVTPLQVQDHDGTPLGKMIIIHDITREKLVDKLKSEFISVAAHQLRTPLTAVKWAIQMVRDGDTGSLTPEQYEMLEKGFVSNQRMINLVNDLLDASRIEEGRFQYALKKIQISEMVQSLLKELDHIIKERDLHFQLNIPSDKIPPVYGDEQKLRMVFQNLIDNAIRYTRSGGDIDISVGYNENSGLVVFTIKDSGVGIPKEAQNHIFSKFFRGENVVRLQTEGSGLGLFIVKNIVKKHRGDITFESEQDKGTRFVVTLPAFNHWEDYKSNEEKN